MNYTVNLEFGGLMIRWLLILPRPAPGLVDNRGTMNNFRRYVPTARPVDTRAAAVLTTSLKTPTPSLASSERKQGFKEANERAKARLKS